VHAPLLLDFGKSQVLRDQGRGNSQKAIKGTPKMQVPKPQRQH